jgi:Na+-translocating ferredoxin:NAD+ oxidoreductase RNF subunit RnfB
MTDEFMIASYERREQVVTDSGPRPALQKEEAVAPPAGQKYEVEESKCIGCTKCARICPVKAISGAVKQPHSIDKSLCVGCGACAEGCPVKAIHPCD